MENELKKVLKDIIKENYDIELTKLKLEIPPKKELGDFAFGGFQLARDLKKSPNIIVLELKSLLEKENSLIESAEVEGPYLNIKLNKVEYIKQIIKKMNIDSFNILRKENINKTIVIDYIGANVGKPLHIGHMCTPNQGQTMINIYKKLGYNVISDSHIGDWGIIFGKLILSYKLWGEEKKLKENAVDYLLELYVKITSETENDNSLEQKTRDEFKLLSEGNPESIELWKDFTKYSIEAMGIQLARLHIYPDYNIGESFYEGLGLPKMENYPDLKDDMKSIVKELIEKSIATKNDDNSVGVIFDDEKIPSCILQKRDGAHGYLASDLACIKYRKQNWDPEKILYFIDSRQQLHLKQAFLIAEKAGWLDKTELFHAANGFISLKDGAMSTRKGKIIKLDKLLDEAENRAKKIILEKRDDISGAELKELSKIIGIGAIKYGYLRKSRELDVVFDWDEFMTFEGNSGPYIQYAYVRAIRILEKGEFLNNKKIEIDNNLKEEIREEVLSLSKCLIKYREILEKTTEENTPHILVGYSYELTKEFNNFYNNISVLNEKNVELRKLGLMLVKEFSQTIRETFNLLGIEMPERM